MTHHILEQGKGEHAPQVTRGGERPLHNLNAHLGLFYARLAIAESELIPFSFWLFAALLAFIAVTGVLMPLQELSAKTDDSRRIYVTLASFGILGLLALILVQFWQLRQLIRIAADDLGKPD